MSSQFLRVWVVIAALFGVAQVACSGDAPGPITDDNTTTGSVALPLTAQSGDVAYRLASARFTITGAPLPRPLVIRPPADTPVHQETLPVGSYSILLENGWQLERKGPADTGFTAVAAELIVPNPQQFSVARNLVTDVLFTFATGTGVVDLGRGRADVRIDVRDCNSYNFYSATIATLTVDCLGRIDQDSYVLDVEGFLRRNFQACPLDDSKLRSIDDFLGLQYRRTIPGQNVNPLPFGKECIAGRWARWRDEFESRGIAFCPNWAKRGETNTPTDALIDAAIKQLPQQFPLQQNPRLPGPPEQLKTNSIYFVSFPPGTPGQQCDTPGSCAAACAEGFPGFVLQQDGATVITDPPVWQLDLTFTTTPNPFMRLGYYHPMSLSGPPPGEIFGHRNRVPEQCSYYNSGYHFLTTLKENCQEMPGGLLNCVSACYQ
jgi:hypothetical protein